MNKRERLERTIAGEETDRPPVTIWRYFPGDDQRSADFARALIAYQARYDWDVVVAMPTDSFCLRGYGLQDVWRGDQSGRRTINRRLIQGSLDWTELRALDPLRGELAKQSECLRLLGDAWDDDATPFVQVIHSPLGQAVRLAGIETFLDHMRRQPDRVRTGLNVLTESTLQFIDVLQRQTKVAGIFYMVDLASYDRLAEAEYRDFGLPYDRKILDTLPRAWWFNILQVNGRSPMLHLFTTMNVQALNWSDQEAHPTLDTAMTSLDFAGAWCGGLGEETHLHYGTPASIRDAGRQIFYATGRRRMILSTGRYVPVTTPTSNLHAVRELV